MTDPADRDAAIEQARQLITAGMVAELITDIRSMAAAILAFGEHLDRTHQQVEELKSLRRRNGIIAAAALGLTIVLAFVVIVGGALLTSIANDNRRNGRTLVECTTPAPPHPSSAEDAVHECYDQAQASQGRAVAQITQTLVDAAICARLEASEQEIRSCISARLQPTTTTVP